MSATLNTTWISWKAGLTGLEDINIHLTYYIDAIYSCYLRSI